MDSFKFELNYAGVGALLKSGEMQSMLDGYASQFCSQCGEGYAMDSYKAGSRNVASVYTDTYEAVLDNYNHNTLKKVCGV